MFSEIIDEALSIVGASDPSTVNAAINYARTTIREVEKQQLFANASVEQAIQLVDTQQDSFTFTKPLNFRRLHVAEYFPRGVEPKFMRPGTLVERDTTYHYYATPTTYVFNGIRGATELRLFYFLWARAFKYYVPALRPAVYDFDGSQTWSYLNSQGNFVPTLNDPVAEANAESLVSTWMLIDWRPVVIEGINAKLFKARGDNSRAVTSFALWKSGQADINATEKFYREDDI